MWKSKSKKKISRETELLGKPTIIKKERKWWEFLQALVGRIMQFPTMQTFVIVTFDTF